MTRPTHWHSGRQAAVFPEHEDPAMLSRLPADYWTEQDAGIAMAAMRARRDELLAASDFTQLDDADKVKKAAWADYRKQLRDLPATQHPLNVVWPDLPQSLQTLI